MRGKAAPWTASTPCGSPLTSVTERALQAAWAAHKGYCARRVCGGPATIVVSIGEHDNTGPALGKPRLAA